VFVPQPIARVEGISTAGSFGIIAQLYQTGDAQ
jgi:hypothetical protein